jgi:hypothetical protein
MRRTIPNTFDRADVLMSAGCSTFISASLIVVLPRIGIVLLEILLGTFLIGCAIAARARLKRKANSNEAVITRASSRLKWFDRYDVIVLLTVVVMQAVLDGLLRRLGWSEGTRRVFPLILLGFAILLKPRLLERIERLRKSQPSSGPGTLGKYPTLASMPIGEAEQPSDTTMRAVSHEERK